MKTIVSVILAAGQGKRMKSTLPKVLHPVAGKPMIFYSLALAKSLGINKRIIVLGHQLENIKETVDSIDQEVHLVPQKNQLGTAQAMQEVVPYLTDFSGTILILSADVPLLSATTVKRIIDYHQKERVAGTILTAKLANPAGYGRIIRDGVGKIAEIVEQADLTEEQQNIDEINSGIYCFHSKELFQALALVKKNNRQKEYYLTDVIKILLKKGYTIGSITIDDPTEIIGINDQKTLSQVSQIIYERNALRHMEEGVTIVSPGNSFIEEQVEIGKGTIIYPFTVITSGSRIGQGCRIGPYAHIVESNIGNETVIFSSQVEKSRIGNNTVIGPFAHLRPDNIIGDKVKIGNYVEVKKTIIGQGTKVGHLAYLGDAILGKKVNIGAGAITCNFDGIRKNQTTVEDGAFIGTNNSLVAPVVIGKDAYTAAGSTIAENVPAGSLGIARARQQNIIDWVAKKKKQHEEVDKK